MKALKDKIRTEGKILPGSVLKVSSFLNHQMDSDFIMKIGEEFARRFQDVPVDKILTIESSGIAVALAVGTALHVPVLFAKKHLTSNIFGEPYQTVVHSYTHNSDYTVVVEREYLNQGEQVLLIDDFLANGKALEGLLELISQAQAGLRVESLAIIEDMDESGIRFRES